MMVWKGSGTSGRTRILALFTVLGAFIPLVAPSGAQAAKYNIGGGVVHGVTEFEGAGLPPVGAPCVVGVDDVDFTVDGLAPSFVYNTVITGYAGAIHIGGGGTSVCAEGAVRTGSLKLTITGTGPTGSQIACGDIEGEELTGGFTRVGSVVTVEIFGECKVNSYGTARIQFLSTLQFTPFDPTGAGTGQTYIKKAFFDGEFVLVPAES
jgi:hypothetical protein